MRKEKAFLSPGKGIINPSETEDWTPKTWFQKFRVLKPWKRNFGMGTKGPNRGTFQ